MALTKDLLAPKKEHKNQNDLDIFRYKELKEKLKIKTLKKLREDRIKKNTSVVHEI